MAAVNSTVEERWRGLLRQPWRPAYRAKNESGDRGLDRRNRTALQSRNFSLG
jgi:hypothetical protein